MTSKNIAVFISGGGSNLKSILDNIDKIRGQVVLVLSDREAGGLDHARERGIDWLVTRDKDEILAKLKEKEIDLIVLAGYLKMIDREIIENYRNRIINIHPSLIPSFSGPGFYGERVHKAVLEKGVRYSGCTTHFVNEIYDDGPIILQAVVPVKEEDKVEDLAARVLIEEHRIMVETVKLFCEDRLELKDKRVIIKDEGTYSR